MFEPKQVHVPYIVRCAIVDLVASMMYGIL